MTVTEKLNVCKLVNKWSSYRIVRVNDGYILRYVKRGDIFTHRFKEFDTLEAMVNKLYDRIDKARQYATAHTRVSGWIE